MRNRFDLLVLYRLMAPSSVKTALKDILYPKDVTEHLDVPPEHGE